MYGFKEIIGHKNIIEHIQNAIKYNKVSHSYIIEGEKGIGKKLIANSLAKTLQCETKGVDSCNKCASCKMFESSNHPDIKYVEASKKSGLGVDDIREQLNKDINIKPYKYPYKIYIINDADTMTIQAQNALLKTIEEPPSYAIIILIAENKNRFLQTIISRCVLIPLRPLSNEDIDDYLIYKVQIPDYQASVYSAFSRGNIGKAKELALSSEFIQMRDHVIEIVNILIKNNDFEIMGMYNIFEDYKDEIDIFIDLIISWLRDLLIVKEINNERYLINKDKYKTILKQGQHLSYNRICVLIDNILHFKKQLKVNVNYQLSIEMMLLNQRIS